MLYGSDGTNQPQYRPSAVARPKSDREIQRVVRACREHREPVIPRGAGSGLTGGALPVQGGVVLVTTRMNRILEIDEDNLVAVVEPGLVTSEFQAVAASKGLFYPPDPASREFSTLGGNVAENAGGTRAIKYGVTRDYVLGLEAVLGTGELIKTGVRTAKGVVGYDLTRLLVGSEGTLGVITKMILRLLPAPEAKETVIAYFQDLDQAGQTVARPDQNPHHPGHPGIHGPGLHQLRRGLPENRPGPDRRRPVADRNRRPGLPGQNRSRSRG